MQGTQKQTKSLGYPFNRSGLDPQLATGGSLGGAPGSVDALVLAAVWAPQPEVAWWR